MPSLLLPAASPTRESQAAIMVALNTESVRDSPSAPPFPGKRGGEGSEGHQEGTQHRKAPTPNGGTLES